MTTLRILGSRPLGLPADAQPDKGGVYVTPFGKFMVNGGVWQEIVNDGEVVYGRDGKPACETCKGTRQVRDDCAVCKGDGVTTCDHCGSEVECEQCDGTGEGDWIECEDCH